MKIFNRALAVAAVAVLAFSVALAQGEPKKGTPASGPATATPGPAHAGMQASGGGDVKAEVTKAERDWETAMKKSDDAALGKILSDGWFATNPDGSTATKAQMLSETKSGKYASAKLDNVDVHTFGSVAVATGKSSDKDGKYSYLDVFVRQGGSWKCVASSLAKIG